MAGWCMLCCAMNSRRQEQATKNGIGSFSNRKKKLDNDNFLRHQGFTPSTQQASIYASKPLHQWAFAPTYGNKPLRQYAQTANCIQYSLAQRTPPSAVQAWWGW